MRCGTASIRLSFRSCWLRTYDSAAHWDNTGRLVAVAYGSLSTVGPKVIPYQGIIFQGWHMHSAHVGSATIQTVADEVSIGSPAAFHSGYPSSSREALKPRLRSSATVS